MAQEVVQQIAQRLQEAEHILLAFPYASDLKESGDSLGSALALYGYLQKLGKRAELAAAGFDPQGRLKFLPQAQAVQSILKRPPHYTLRVKTAPAQFKEFSYAMKESGLEIYLTPEQEQSVLRPEDLELTRGQYKYDTIVTLNTPDLAALGQLFEAHAELFYRTPIINLDHHSSNEQYGQINYVNINAAATGELLTEMLQTIGHPLLDADMATNLFAAIFLKTHGFKNPTITPNTLKLAAELLGLGARREELMQQVYRSRSLSALKLWGKALAHLKHDPETRLTWSTLTEREILESSGALEDLPEVIEELIFTSPEALITALLYEESAGRICVLLASKKPSLSPRALPWEVLETSSSRTKYCLFNQTLASAERAVIDKLKEMLKLLPQS